MDTPSQSVFGLARFCADGTLDTTFGGFRRDWHQEFFPNIQDADGTVTVSFGYIDETHWMKQGEAFGAAVQPDGRIVVGGYADLNPNFGTEPEASPTRFFAVARLCDDGHRDDGAPGGCGPGFGPDDLDPGRIWFDGGTDGVHTDDVIHGIQLVEDQEEEDEWDILVAGTDRGPSASQRDFFVARINYSGADGAANECGQHDNEDAVDVCEWATFIGFTEGRDDIGLDLVVNDSESEIIVAGVTCTMASCIGNTAHVSGADVTPSSHYAFGRLDVADGDVDYSYQVTEGPLEDTYTDVPFSVVLQPGDESPFIVIGGYSVDENTGTSPYMSGVRFDYDVADPDVYDFFISEFDNTTGTNGDQAWELRVQDDRNIVAGGLHTGSSGPVMGALRLCEEPDGDPCGSSRAAPSPSGGSVHGNVQPPSLSDPMTTVSTVVLPPYAFSPATEVSEATFALFNQESRAKPRLTAGPWFPNRKWAFIEMAWEQLRFDSLLTASTVMNGVTPS